jgi:hypothetical protein
MTMAAGARVSTDGVDVDGPKLGSTMCVDVDADEYSVGSAVGSEFSGASSSGSNKGDCVLGDHVGPTAEGGGVASEAARRSMTLHPITDQQYPPSRQSVWSPLGQCVSKLQPSSALSNDDPQKLVLIGSSCETGLSVAGTDVDEIVGRKVGWGVMSRKLQVVSAQHSSPSSHSSSEPPGHHIGLPLPSQLVDASIHDTPQNLKFCGSS